MYKQEDFMKNIAKVYVGVDISKDTLDIHIYPLNKAFKIANSIFEIKKLLKELSKYNVEQIGCEATGGYEKLLAKTLEEGSLKLWVIDPRRIKGFIVSSGCKSKSDKIDARKIAEFISKNSRSYEPFIKTANQEKVQALINRKNGLSKFLSAEKTRFKHPSHAFYKSHISDFMKTIEKEIKAIDQQIKTLIENDEELNRKSKLLTSIPGIGQPSAALLLSFVPEIGYLSNKKISALTGLCPYDRESGKYRGKRFISGGRVAPRKMLYMCALTAIKYFPWLKNFYDRLISNKKPFKIAITAVMHKLIIFANSVLKKGELCNA
jgi:transposase